MLDNRSDLLIPHGVPSPPWSVILHSQAYTTLIEVAAMRMPAETVGALLGEARDSGDGRKRLEIKEVAPIRLAYEQSRLAPILEEWEGIKSRLSESIDARMSIIGWFYADPGMGIFAPRVDIAQVQRTLATDLSLFLLVHPFTDQGAFYVWQDGSLAAAGGFYEALPDGGVASVIPWDGLGLVTGLAVSSPSASASVAKWQVPGYALRATQSPTATTDVASATYITEVIETASAYLPAAAYLADPSRGHLYRPGILPARLWSFGGTQENWRRAWLGIGALMGIALIATLASMWLLNGSTDSTTQSGISGASSFSPSQPRPIAKAGTISLLASPSTTTVTTVEVGVGLTPSLDASPISTYSSASTSVPTATGPAAPVNTPANHLPEAPTSPHIPGSNTPISLPTAQPTNTPTPGSTLERTNTPFSVPDSTPIHVATSTRTIATRPTSTMTPTAHNTNTRVPVAISTTALAPSSTSAPVPTNRSALRPTRQPAYTSVSVSTDTPMPFSTGTPASVPSNTPIPVPTDARPPAPTEPPAITPTNTTEPIPTTQFPPFNSYPSGSNNYYSAYLFGPLIGSSGTGCRDLSCF